MKYIAVAMFFIISPLSGSILSRSTFESWEGPFPYGWSVDSTWNGKIYSSAENGDPESNQIQAHGKWSVQIYDPDDTSSASASEIFNNDSSEYMIEFYIWIRSEHATIDTFPLCVLWDTTSNEKTDIALYIHPPSQSSGPCDIHVVDSSGMHHEEANIDTTDRWYKIQIYRHDGVVNFYLGGDSIGTYSPMNSGYVSNKIVFGTTSADSLRDGEVFYDDLIVSTPPIGDHPRLLFDDDDLDTLRNRKDQSDPGNLGVSYKEMWDSLEVLANEYLNDSFFTYPWPSPPDTIDTLYYPFPQLPYHMHDTDHDWWLDPIRKLNSRLNTISFVGIIDGDSACIDYVKNILNSLANWRSFVNMSHHGGRSRYAHLCTGELTYNMALAYDWLYDSLTPYERMNVQNTLINLGINQMYLQISYPEYINPLNYANGQAVIFGGGLGISCLALDSADLATESLAAYNKIDTLLCHSPDALGPDGGFNEGCSYAGFALDYFIAYLEANNNLGSYINDCSFLKNYPKWRIHCMLPGAENYQMVSSGQGPNWDITFCDYDHRGGLWRAAMCRLADLLDIGEHCQWYQSKRQDIRFDGSLYYLWARPSLDTVPPDTFTLTKVFTSIGWALARTGWSENDYLFALKSGQKEPLTHRQKEQNSFIFGGKGRWLIADAGYGREPEWKERLYHNGLDSFEKCDSAMWRRDSLIYKYCTFSADTFTYFESIDTSYYALDPWVRKIIFFNKLGSFVINDYAECDTSIDSLHWRIHSWKKPIITDNDKRIEITYADGPKLRGYVVFPESVDIDTNTLEDISFNENDTTRYFHRISVKIDTTFDTIRVVVGFAPYETEDSVQVAAINGLNLTGAKLKNENGCAAALFGMSDSIKGGQYDVSVTNSLLNVVCNLVPDTSYSVITRRDTFPETDTTLQTNDVGILSFKLNGTGEWKILTTLARTTGSIEINKDSSYCNMPFVALNLHSLNPLSPDSLSADSMRIWQDYSRNDTLYTDSTGWIPYDSAYLWHLKQNEGANTIYAQFMADGWNESAEYSDSIVFDKTAPTGSFVINEDSTFTNNSNVTFKNSLNDSESGMSEMRYGNKFLKNLVNNPAFDVDSHWVTDTARFNDSLKLYEIPLDTIGNYFYQSILPESLADFEDDTMLLWIDLVSNGFVGTAKVKFQYIYSDSADPRGSYPVGDTIIIPEGTHAGVSHYNLRTYFRYHPDPESVLYEARVGVFADSASINSGTLFIDNLRLDVMSPFDDYSLFEDYDTLKNWTLIAGNGVRKVYGQFSDGAGNETGVLLDSIIVDGVPPNDPYVLSRKLENNAVLMCNKITTDTVGNPESIDYYVVHRDTTPDFIPSSSDSIGAVLHPETTYTDTGVLDSSVSYYYLVMAVDSASNKSKKSNMGYVLQKFVNYNTDRSSRNWVSLPWHSGYSTVSELVADLSPAGDPLESITNLRDDMVEETWLWDTDFMEWSGPNDFAIDPGRGYEMVVIKDTNLVLVGSNNPAGLCSLNHNTDRSSRNWVSIPCNAAYSTASDIATEYSPVGDPLEAITNLRDDMITETWLYDTDFMMWYGPNDFAIVPARGYEFVPIKDTTWNPTEHSNEASDRMLENRGVKQSGVEIYGGQSLEPDRAPMWIVKESEKKIDYSNAKNYMLVTRSLDEKSDYREPGISHIVRVHLSVKEFDNLVFTAYRPEQPYDVLTENMSGSCIAIKGDQAAFFFNVANFKRPWQDEEEVILIIEALKQGKGYFTVVNITLDARVDIQEVVDDITFMPIPAVVIAKGSVSWDAVDNDNVIGYSLYKNDKRVNEKVLTKRYYRAGGDINLKLVIKGGYETVYGSRVGSQSTPDKDIPISFAFNILPNPFAKQTRINYALPRQTSVELVIYDVSGRQVKTLVSEEHSPGYYSSVWNGADDKGRKVSSGIYFIGFKADEFRARDKILLVK